MLGAVRRREARADDREGVAAHVEPVGGASETAAVVEVRTGRPPRAALRPRRRPQPGRGCRSGRRTSATLAGQAIDTFYLTEPDGSRPSRRAEQEALAALVAAAGSETVTAA